MLTDKVVNMIFVSFGFGAPCNLASAVTGVNKMQGDVRVPSIYLPIISHLTSLEKFRGTLAVANCFAQHVRLATHR